MWIKFGVINSRFVDGRGFLIFLYRIGLGVQTTLRNFLSARVKYRIYSINAGKYTIGLNGNQHYSNRNMAEVKFCDIGYFFTIVTFRKYFLVFRQLFFNVKFFSLSSLCLFMGILRLYEFSNV